MGKAGDLLETEKEHKCNFKFKISDFK